MSFRKSSSLIEGTPFVFAAALLLLTKLLFSAIVLIIRGSEPEFNAEI